MSNEEQRRILGMVAEGKLSAEEAAELLDALQPEPVAEQTGPSWSDVQQAPRRPGIPPVAPRRSLVINISEAGDNKVNVRIPLGLARTATRFIPGKVQEYLDEYDIDLKELMSDLGNNLTEGPLVEIKDDEDTVRIAVE